MPRRKEVKRFMSIAGVWTVGGYQIPLPAVAAVIAAVVLAAFIIWLHQRRRAMPKIEDLINDFGFEYDEGQDIFYSTMDAWQRKYGYCWLYDEAAAPMSMIIDCEPITFEYEGKRWLIEFWKGQYGMTTGIEVGVYTAPADVIIPAPLTFYGDTLEEDCLNMSFMLMRQGHRLFSRKSKHWWLNGFRLGEFSEPEQLSAIIRIQLKTRSMRRHFIRALKRAGYTDGEYKLYNDRSVKIYFTAPHTKQPLSRTKAIEDVVQKNNKALCDIFQESTGALSNGLDKLRHVQSSDKRLYRQIKKSLRGKGTYKKYRKASKSRRNRREGPL